MRQGMCAVQLIAIARSAVMSCVRRVAPGQWCTNRKGLYDDLCASLSAVLSRLACTTFGLPANAFWLQLRPLRYVTAVQWCVPDCNVQRSMTVCLSKLHMHMQCNCISLDSQSNTGLLLQRSVTLDTSVEPSQRAQCHQFWEGFVLEKVRIPFWSPCTAYCFAQAEETVAILC